MTAYAELCGWTLAKAHARSGDAIAIGSYLGSGDVFDQAIASFAETYADQNERDYAALKEAVDSGLVVKAEVRACSDREDGDPDEGAEEDRPADPEQDLALPQRLELRRDAGEEEARGEEDDGEHVVVGALVRVSAASGGRRPRRSAAALTASATRYCGIANGVRGAFGFVRGLVASHAAKAGRNSFRNRCR